MVPEQPVPDEVLHLSFLCKVIWGQKVNEGSILLLVARILLKRGLSFAMWRGVSPAIIPSVE